ncbi:MAG: chromate transporter [Victivallales bacterium]
MRKGISRHDEHISYLSAVLLLRTSLLRRGERPTPLYIDHLVNEQHWMTLQEFGDLTAISQMTPGPIGVNAATFFGFRRGGIPVRSWRQSGFWCRHIFW